MPVDDALASLRSDIAHGLVDVPSGRMKDFDVAGFAALREAGIPLAPRLSDAAEADLVSIWRHAAEETSEVAATRLCERIGDAVRHSTTFRKRLVKRRKRGTA